VENSLWKRLRTCRKTGYRQNKWFPSFPAIKKSLSGLRVCEKRALRRILGPKEEYKSLCKTQSHKNRNIVPLALNPGTTSSEKDAGGEGDQMRFGRFVENQSSSRSVG